MKLTFLSSSPLFPFSVGNFKLKTQVFHLQFAQGRDEERDSPSNAMDILCDPKRSADARDDDKIHEAGKVYRLRAKRQMAQNLGQVAKFKRRYGEKEEEPVKEEEAGNK